MDILKKQLFVYFSLFIFSCSSTPISRFNSINVPEDIFGIVHAGKTNSQEEYLLLDELGAKWILNTFSWRNIEKEKGKFDFSMYDEYVDTAKKAGKKIVAVLGFEAPWIFPDGNSKKFISPENYHHYLNYVEETVRHYKGRIDVWEIWNEPNILRFWKGSKKVFFELSRLTALKIKEIDPDAHVIGGAFSLAPRGFIKKMHKAGALDDLDGIAFHPYGLNPAFSMRTYDKFLDILSEINYSQPVWITEVGFPTGGWYPTKVSLDGLPSHVIKTISGAAARGARVLLWYEMFDSYKEGDLASDSEKYFGLAYSDFRRKEGAWAYELCATFLPGARYEKDYPIKENIPKGIIVMCFLEGHSGNNTLILWNDKICTQKIDLYLPAPAFIYNISTGEKKPLEEKTRLDINKTPLFITWQEEIIPQLSTAIK